MKRNEYEMNSFALLCIALHCLALLGIAWHGLAWLGFASVQLHEFSTVGRMHLANCEQPLRTFLLAQTESMTHSQVASGS